MIKLVHLHEKIIIIINDNNIIIIIVIIINIRFTKIKTIIYLFINPSEISHCAFNSSFDYIDITNTIIGSCHY